MKILSEKEAQKETPIYQIQHGIFDNQRRIVFHQVCKADSAPKKTGLDVSSNYENDMKCAEMTQAIAKLFPDNLSHK